MRLCAHAAQSRPARPMGLAMRAAASSPAWEDVTHVKEGDHVISTWVSRTPISGLPVSRPTGATLHGRPVIADGDVYTWSEHMVTFAEKVVPMSPADPADAASLIGCAVLTGAGAVLHTANVGRGQSVAVCGAGGVGGVGLSVIGAAAIAGADPIIAVDLADRKLRFAREFGATHSINASKADPVNEIWAVSPGGVDYAFDAVGVPATTLQILGAARQGGPRADNQGGTAVLLGIPVADVSVDLNDILLYQRHYCGSLGARASSGCAEWFRCSQSRLWDRGVGAPISGTRRGRDLLDVHQFQPQGPHPIQQCVQASLVQFRGQHGGRGLHVHQDVGECLPSRGPQRPGHSHLISVPGHRSPLSDPAAAAHPASHAGLPDDPVKMTRARRAARQSGLRPEPWPGLWPAPGRGVLRSAPGRAS